jgi:Holliday junction resolvasome RuvABC endonuclease subunit
MIILGIDPGETTGYALIELDKDGDRVMKLLDYGTIPTTHNSWEGRMVQQIRFIGELCEKNTVDEVAYECGIQSSKIVTSPLANELRGALKVKLFTLQVRGIIGVVAGYYPISVKKVIRNPKMTKAEMRQWIGALFGLGNLKSPDMADAIAVASCHALTAHKAKFPMSAVELPSKARKSAVHQTEQDKLSKLTDAEIVEGIKIGKLRVNNRGKIEVAKC